MQIEDLHQEISTCTRCSLHQFRINTPFSEGTPSKKLMIVAQAPGEKENLTGKIFVGPAGEVLDEIFEVNGIDRNDIYITNLIKCFLPKSKRPSNNQISACCGYLDREIEMIDPSTIVTLGYFATKYIYEKYTADSLSKPDIHDLIGKVYYIRGKKILSLQHPSTLLYNSTARVDMIKGYHKLKVLMEDCKYYPFCAVKKCHDRGLLSEEWVELYCHGDWENCVRYKMEESGIEPSNGMLPDGRQDKILKNFPN